MFYRCSDSSMSLCRREHFMGRGPCAATTGHRQKERRFENAESNSSDRQCSIGYPVPRPLHRDVFNRRNMQRMQFAQKKEPPWMEVDNLVTTCCSLASSTLTMPVMKILQERIVTSFPFPPIYPQCPWTQRHGPSRCSTFIKPAGQRRLKLDFVSSRYIN